MFFADLACKSDGDFKRLTGVSRLTFGEMLAAYSATKRRFGRPPKLTYADQLLLTLMYFREYRTLFHIAKTYGISEANTCKIVHTVENALIRDKRFHLPGKKVLLQANTTISVIAVDVAESPIERPQKNSSSTTAARRSATRSKPS